MKDYADWILREARGAMKLSRVARTILFTYCPFSAETMKALEGQTAYSEAAKKYIRDNRAARKESGHDDAQMDKSRTGCTTRNIGNSRIFKRMK